MGSWVHAAERLHSATDSEDEALQEQLVYEITAVQEPLEELITQWEDMITRGGVGNGKGECGVGYNPCRMYNMLAAKSRSKVHSIRLRSVPIRLVRL